MIQQNIKLVPKVCGLVQKRSIGRFNAFITICKDENEPGTSKDDLTVAVKDCFCTKDILTTCASKMLSNFVPPYSATVVEKLVQAGKQGLKCSSENNIVIQGTKNQTTNGTTKLVNFLFD